MNSPSIATAMCVGATIEQTRNEGKVMEATTPGKFMMPDGDKVYNTFAEMVADQPMKADVAPLFVDEAEYEIRKKRFGAMPKGHAMSRSLELEETRGLTFREAFFAAEEESALATQIDLMSMAVREEAGFPLDKMEENDAEFKKMYDEMFARQAELGKLGAGDIESRMSAYQNGLSESKVENINGGDTHNVSTGGSAVHSPKRPSTPLYYAEPDVAAGPLVPAA